MKSYLCLFFFSCEGRVCLCQFSLSILCGSQHSSIFVYWVTSGELCCNAPLSLLSHWNVYLSCWFRFKVCKSDWMSDTYCFDSKNKNSKKKNSNDKSSVNVFLSSQLSLQASQVTFIPFCWWFHFCQWRMKLFILTHGTFQLFYLYFPITNSVAIRRELFLSLSNIKHTHKKWEINNSYDSGAWFEMGKEMFWAKGLFLQEFHTPVIFAFTKPIFFFPWHLVEKLERL